MELSFFTWICVEREVGVEQEKTERFSERVSECVDVCAGSLPDTYSHEMPHASN